MKQSVLVLIVALLGIQVQAQKISNVTANQEGNNIIVSYKVDGGTTGSVFISALFYSTDGGSSYNKCNSTSAKYTKPNQTAQITWDVTNDLDYFGGSNIVFKVIAYPRVLLNGVEYKFVELGNQVWMSENLNLNVGVGCWCYDNTESNCRKYGRLYTWKAAKRAANKITGWHLPTDAEWKQLEISLGMSKNDADDTGWRGNIGKKLKSTSGWHVNCDGSNSSGFSALPGGYRDSYHRGFFNMGDITYFWTASEYSNSNAWTHNVSCYHSEVRRNDSDKDNGFAVRLVRD